MFKLTKLFTVLAGALVMSSQFSYGASRQEELDIKESIKPLCIGLGNPSHIFRELQHSSVEERGSIVRCARNFITHSMQGSDRLNILRILSPVSSNAEREQVTSYAQKLILPDLRLWDCLNIIKIIRDLPSTERNNFVVCAQLIASNMHYDYNSIVSDILGVLKEIPDEERRSFNAFTQNPNLACIETIRVLRDLPHKEREDFVALIQLISRKDHHLSTLLYSFAEIVAEERKDVMVLTQRFTVPEMTNRDYAGIIPVLKGIPPAEREEIVTLTQKLLPFLNGKKIHEEIMSNLRIIPSPEKERAIAFIQNSIKPETPENGMDKIIIDILQKRKWRDRSQGQSVPRLDSDDSILIPFESKLDGL
ncbi:MAG: hypothetical protein WCG05_03765 [Alphaproteobacteria bacterium]